MNEHSIDSLRVAAFNAVDVFGKLHEKSSTYMGVMDKTLRAQGFNVSAVVIDCNITKKRISMVVRDDIPDTVAVGVGLKDANEIGTIKEFAIDGISTKEILEMMEKHFAHDPAE